MYIIVSLRLTNVLCNGDIMNCAEEISHMSAVCFQKDVGLPMIKVVVAV
jgi:hypothetical protein